MSKGASFAVTGAISSTSLGASNIGHDHIRSARVRFRGAIGELTVRQGFFRDEVILREEVPAGSYSEKSAQEHMTPQLEILARAAGLSFEPARVSTHVETLSPVPPPDFEKGASFEAIRAYHRYLRDHPDGVTEVLVSEYRTPGDRAPAFLSQLIEKHGEDLRFIEILRPDGGEKCLYSEDADNPELDILSVVRTGLAAESDKVEALQKSGEKKIQQDQFIEQTRTALEGPKARAGTVEIREDEVILGGVPVRRQPRKCGGVTL